MNHSITKLSEREHIIKRPAMYIGSVDLTKTNEYIQEDGKVQYKEVEYVPGLIKIINEIIDNSVDVAIKSNFKHSNIIQVQIDDKKITVQDNGTGIPIQKSPDGRYLPEICWNSSRTGSNFDNDDEHTQIGLNGVGSFATNCFSKKFIGETDDGKKSYKITFKNGAESFTEEINTTKLQGTKVTFYPDLEMFNLTEIDEVHQLLIKQRLLNLSMSFPEITFKFNKRKISSTNFRSYLKMFNPVYEMYETENMKFAILPNESDDFRQFSYVNGLKIPDGGTHIDVITNNIVNGLRDKLIRKYKTIKPGDIRNKLQVIVFIKNLPNPKFNSQAKEKITNSVKEINTFLGTIDYQKMINKILKTPEIIDNITELYRAKEEIARRKELKGLNNTKKIKSEKYLPSIGIKKYLFITEGASATGGLIGPVGRKTAGFYELKGKPLNAYSSSTAKFTSNKELSELYSIIQNEGYSNIVIATDADLDGMHIRGLLIGFFHRYLPNISVGILNTPVIGIKKNNKLIKWTYDLRETIEPKKGETSKFYKGLGSWKEKDLLHIIETEGLSKMIDMLEFDDLSKIEDWLGDKTADTRKEYIQQNDFSIAKL